MALTILASLSAWSLALIPLPGRENRQRPAHPRVPPAQRRKAVRLPGDVEGPPSSLLLPAGAGPHPAMLLDTADRSTNLRAEAHRFASIGVAAFYRDVDDGAAADPMAEVVKRADYLRNRLDINPYELGVLCVGEPVHGWLEAAADRDVAFLIRVTIHPTAPRPVQESVGPRGTPMLDVFAQTTPLEPDITRLVDRWLLRHVTIRP